jgi:hypothetical protein
MWMFLVLRDNFNLDLVTDIIKDACGYSTRKNKTGMLKAMFVATAEPMGEMR